MYMKNEITDERINNALSIAWRYGQINGESHKAWVIDQIVRTLLNNKDNYKNWVEAYETPLSYGESYEWQTGIAP